MVEAKSEILRLIEEERDILKTSRAVLCQGTRVKYRFVNDHRQEFRIAPMCRMPRVTRGGFYQWLHKPMSDQAIEGGQLHLSGLGGDDAAGYSRPDRMMMLRTGREFPTTPAHEFGHILGLGHRYSSPSIMGWGDNSPNRRVTGYDLRRVVRMYGSGP